MSKKSLGRGLGAILGEVAEAYEKEVPQDRIIELDIEAIRKNPYQPRRVFDKSSLKELAASIKRHGLLQPVVVVEDLDGFVLIAGERRLRACEMAGVKKIKAVVADIDKSKFREYALIENIQREDLKPLELAASYKELIEEYEITHEELADIVKKSRSHITNTLRLLTLSRYAKEALAQEKISAGHAKLLVGLDEEEQKVVVDSIVGQRLSVRDTEKLLQSKKRAVTKSDRAKRVPLDMKRVDEVLKRSGFTYKLGRNKVEISFGTQDDIDKFIEFFS